MTRKVGKSWESVPAWAQLSPAELEVAEAQLVAGMTRDDLDLAHWVEIGALGVAHDPHALAGVRLRQLSEVPEALRTPEDWGDLVGYWRLFDLLPVVLPPARPSLAFAGRIWAGLPVAGFALAA